LEKSGFASSYGPVAQNRCKLDFLRGMQTLVDKGFCSWLRLCDLLTFDKQSNGRRTAIESKSKLNRSYKHRTRDGNWRRCWHGDDRRDWHAACDKLLWCITVQMSLYDHTELVYLTRSGTSSRLELSVQKQKQPAVVDLRRTGDRASCHIQHSRQLISRDWSSARAKSRKKIVRSFFVRRKNALASFNLTHSVCSHRLTDSDKIRNGGLGSG